MMHDEDIQWIERYFVGGLTPEEMLAFEARRANDPAFGQVVAEYAEAVQQVQLVGRKALKTRLSRLDESLPPIATNRRFPYWSAILLAAATVLALWSAFRYRAQTLMPTPPLPGGIRDSIVATRVVPVDTTALRDTVASEGPKVSKSAPLSPNQPSSDALFATYFRPFRDSSIEPSVRGDGDATPEEYFYQLYWQQEYRTALGAFEQMEPASKQKGDLRFLKANCLLAESRLNAASALLDSIVSAERTRFPGEARWLLALTLVKQNKHAAARAMLSGIVTDATSAHQEEARLLLRKLQ